jgi:MFS family permease
MILISVVLFFIGAVVGSQAQNALHFLVSRSVQGVGGGGIIVLTEIVVTDMVPLRDRGRWFGILSTMWSLGSVCGPIIGGVLVQQSTWVSVHGVASLSYPVAATPG